MGKRLIVLICLINILLFLGVSLVFAQACGRRGVSCAEYCTNPCPPNAGGFRSPSDDTFCICSPTTNTNLQDLLDDIINYIFWIASAITPILIIIGGFYFITSGGEIERVNKAKRIITYTIVGFAIVLFARGLVAIFKDLLG
jgi:hypothetical protein